jgi:hypothetical protein
MNRIAVAQELVKVAKELIGRQADSNGKPIRPVEHYALRCTQAANRGKYLSGGSLHSPDFSVDIDEAEEITGSQLLNMGYDWTMNWEAILIR